MARFTGKPVSMQGHLLVCQECGALLEYASCRAWDIPKKRVTELVGIVSCPTIECASNIAEKTEKACDLEMEWLRFAQDLYGKGPDWRK